MHDQGTRIINDAVCTENLNSTIGREEAVARPDNVGYHRVDQGRKEKTAGAKKKQGLRAVNTCSIGITVKASRDQKCIDPRGIVREKIGVAPRVVWDLLVKKIGREMCPLCHCSCNDGGGSGSKSELEEELDSIVSPHVAKESNLKFRTAGKV